MGRTGACPWNDTHPLIRVSIQLTLKIRDKHLFLVEAGSITRALLVKLLRRREEAPRRIHCQFVGPIYFTRPQTGKEAGVEIEVRIGDVEGMGELENGKAFDYVLKMVMAVNPNIQDAKERTQLLSGAKSGGDKQSEEVWLENRPDPNAREVIRVLREKVNDLNSRGKYEKAALHMAAERGYASAVCLLLDERKDDVNGRDSMKRTPLLLAVVNGNDAVVELLLKGNADPNLADKYQRTALHHAAWGGFKAIVEQLLKYKANPLMVDKLGRSALHLGAERGEEDVVQVLLEKTTNVNVSCIGDDGQTLLHSAAWGGSKAVVILLLEKRVDPDTKDKKGQRALHLAAGQGHMLIVRLLLENTNGVVDVLNFKGQTPLFEAAQNQLLLTNGADLKLKNHN